MSPVMQTTVADTASQTPPERVSSHQTEGLASWSQWEISKYPPELLSRIFSYLGCEDIARVRDTCKRFRAVVEACHYETFFYHQLPGTFRKHYPQSLSWQKQMIKNHLHPFTTVLPDKMSKCFKAEQEAAVVCFHTLREMMSTSGYQAVEVFSCPRPAGTLRVEFSLTSSNLLFYEWQISKVCLLGQDGAGSWSAQEVDQEKLPGFRPFAALNSRSRKTYFCLYSSDNITEYFSRDIFSNRWQLHCRDLHDEVNNYQFSSPGKYTAIIAANEAIESIRCFDDQGQWVPMPMAENAWVGDKVGHVRFSPSEQHLAIVSEDKIVILSLDDSQECWNLSGATTVGQLVHGTEEATKVWVEYANFSPSGDWLLARLCVKKSNSVQGSIVMFKPDSAGKWQYCQRIPTQYYELTFSLGGRYLVSWEEQKLCELWALQECGEWLLCSNSNHPGTLPLPGLGQTDLKQNIIQFSTCDNYLCAGSEDGLVSIWNRSKKGDWEIRGKKWCIGRVRLIKFSPSSVLALTIDCMSLHVWSRNEGGLWSVKETIPARGVYSAYFHPAAEHLIVFWNSERIWIWEIRKED